MPEPSPANQRTVKPEVIAYVLRGHDNDSYMLLDAPNLVRCPVCGELLERPRSVHAFKIRKKRDVSTTYDGYTIVCQKFVDEWSRNGGEGLDFTCLPQSPGYFAVDANFVVAYDAERRKTRFEEYRTCCNRFRCVAGATPAYLKPSQTLLKTLAARTDVEFGSGDEKHPLIIIPLEIGNVLKQARLSGLDFNKVLA